MGSLARPSTEPAVRTCRGPLRRRVGTAALPAHRLGHPTSGTEHPLEQGRQVEIRVQPWPMQSQTRWTDLDFRQIGRSCACQPLREIDGDTDLQPIAQCDNDASCAAVITRRRCGSVGDESAGAASQDLECTVHRLAARPSHILSRPLAGPPRTGAVGRRQFDSASDDGHVPGVRLRSGLPPDVHPGRLGGYTCPPALPPPRKPNA